VQTGLAAGHAFAPEIQDSTQRPPSQTIGKLSVGMVAQKASAEQVLSEHTPLTLQTGLKPGQSNKSPLGTSLHFFLQNPDSQTNGEPTLIGQEFDAGLNGSVVQGWFTHLLLVWGLQRATEQPSTSGAAITGGTAKGSARTAAVNMHLGKHFPREQAWVVTAAVTHSVSTRQGLGTHDPNVLSNLLVSQVSEG
jgi:hypothetical protein